MAAVINGAVVTFSLLLVFFSGVANVHGDAATGVVICNAIALIVLESRDVFQARRHQRTVGVMWISFLLIVVNALTFFATVLLTASNHFQPNPYVFGSSLSDWARSVSHLAMASIAGYFWYSARHYAKSPAGAK